jgi:hypothetical protein
LRRVAEELAAAEIEAGVEGQRDPPAPGGDLKHDLDTFANLDTCVRAHAVSDPVLADVVDALGYDTLVRDACRTLQALKARDGKLCEPIASSPVRQRCESQVAVLAGEPSLCPRLTGGMTGARDPVCLARASRDERLCAAAATGDRETCRALVFGRSNECGSDRACIRQVERFRSLLEKPARHTAFPARLHVELTGERGTSEHLEASFDLDEIAAAGAIARSSGDKVRLLVGTPRSARWPTSESPQAKPQLFLALTVPAKGSSALASHADAEAGLLLGPTDLTLDLLVPKVGLLSGTLASDRRLVIEAGTLSAGSPLRLTLTAKVNDAPRVFRLKIDLESFVRDGVDGTTGKKAP